MDPALFGEDETNQMRTIWTEMSVQQRIYTLTTPLFKLLLPDFDLSIREKYLFG